jgi:hypothetical protein
MNTRLRRLAPLAASLLTAATAGIVLAAPAHAATASCYAGSCTGLNPAATTCQYDAETLLTGASGDTSIELRYSPSCRATWARLTYSRGTGYIEVKNSWGQYETASVDFTGSGTVYTRMVNDANITSFAEYVWDGGNQWDSTGSA